MTASRDKETFHELHEGDSADHIIFLFFSYSYTSPIAPKIVDYRRVLRVYNIDDLKAQPLACSCHKLFSI